MMIQNEHIICLSSSQWDSPTRVNPHHLMARLAKHNRILYVDPISLRFPSGSKKDLTKISGRLKGWFKGAQQVDEQLWVFSPLLIPLHRFQIVQIFNRLLLRWSLKRVQNQLDLQNPILWIFLPTGVVLLGACSEKLVIYHCVDQYSANPGVDRKSIEELENQLLEKADLVFTTSQSLYQAKKEKNPSTFYFPNVADFDHFKKGLDAKLQIPADLQAIPKPRAGFIGNLSNYKVDFELLAFAAEQLPHVSFVLIGPVGSGDPGTDISVLTNRKNMYLLGPKNYDQLPAYLKGFDVCLIPFQINDTTRHVFPMKFFEYLAVGKPVVTTCLPALKEFASYCYLADKKNDFVEFLQIALQEKNSYIQKQRLKLAEKNSWKSRVEDISGVIQNKLHGD